MGKLIIINAPRSFTTIWGFVKQLLSERTVQKVEILGNNYSGFLLSLIPPENLPAKFGGKCECAGGCQFSNLGPWVDGRKERREAWLRGERPEPGVDWSPVETDELSRSAILDVGTVRMDEEELQALALSAGETSPAQTPSTRTVAISA
jgi:hypothetical protein